MKTATDNKKPKSAVLNETEFLTFLSKVAEFLTKEEAASFFDISSHTMNLITLKKGRGSYGSIEKIRAKLLQTA